MNFNLTLAEQLFILSACSIGSFFDIRGFLYGLKLYQLNNSAYKKRKKNESLKEWFLYTRYKEEIPKIFRVYYFSNISGDGTLTIYLSYDDLVSFTILGGTPVAIKGYSWSAPMIWDNFHAKEITAMPINAPGTDEVYYVVDSGILFDDENGSISLEINSQSG